MRTVELVFWFLLRRELNRRCCHGKWDRSLNDLADEPPNPPLEDCFCVYCDTGMST